MATYVFSFMFPNLDSGRREITVKAWGGHLGIAFNRAWKTLRRDEKYREIKKLSHTGIHVGISVEEET